MIETFIAELDRSLHGPRRVKTRLLEEARSGLLDAIDSYRATGSDPVDAARQALVEFGGVVDVAPAFRPSSTPIRAEFSNRGASQ